MQTHPFTGLITITIFLFWFTVLVIVFSWMGRAIIERPLREIADFLRNQESAIIYDKHITVHYINITLQWNLVKVNYMG